MKNTIAGIIIGLVAGYLGPLITGYSSAIAIPETFRAFLSGGGAVLWEVFVVHLLGYGLIVFTFVFLASRLIKLHPWATAATAIITCEATLYFFHTSEYTLHVPHIVALAFCAFLSATLSRKSANISPAV
ncbi:hypothetical protein [Microbulbifer sp. A4B17]|uniref:hypothetical protein n=1 Tax=Microbulbifer sp. A4B17 TaxID=359370 RepID=UPI0013004725|nr:hypothetical protein [Microbulbifer sp. A4B17]